MKFLSVSVVPILFSISSADKSDARAALRGLQQRLLPEDDLIPCQNSNDCNPPETICTKITLEDGSRSKDKYCRPSGMPDHANGPATTPVPTAAPSSAPSAAPSSGPSSAPPTVAPPLLRYTFDDFTESMTGNSDFDLVLGSTPDNTAQLKSDDGTYLSCDGMGDYVLTDSNLNQDLGDHSLSVWVRLSSLQSQGGGAISLDGDYSADASYSHAQFDAIVYNEISNDRRWMLGSEFHARTQRGTAVTQESAAGQWLHMVAVYDVTNSLATLYRNGAIEQSYTPPSFKTSASSSRVMFCQRHFAAGGSDFEGDVDLGELYDYALSADDVASLYSRGRTSL